MLEAERVVAGDLTPDERVEEIRRSDGGLLFKYSLQQQSMGLLVRIDTDGKVTSVRSELIAQVHPAPSGVSARDNRSAKPTVYF